MLVYILSPFDLLPESLLGPFGLFDDGFMMLNLFKEVSGLIMEFNREESMRARNRVDAAERERLVA